jgi:hypothetical protein
VPTGEPGGGRAAHAFTSTLLRVGVTEPPRLPGTLVRSYRTVSPLPLRRTGSAVCFLLPCPASYLDWPLASTLPCGAPTFLNPVICMPSRGHPANSLSLADPSGFAKFWFLLQKIRVPVAVCATHASDLQHERRRGSLRASALQRLSDQRVISELSTWAWGVARRPARKPGRQRPWTQPATTSHAPA